MIAYIRGTLEGVGEDYVIIDNGQIGYEVRVPLSLLSNLPKLGEELKLFTYLYVREDAMQLYGFISSEDLSVFKLLLTVSGIGPKGALGILSCLSSDALRYAILTEDDAAISKAPGIGKKTAQRVIIDLKDKLKLQDLSALNQSAQAVSQGNSVGQDIVQEAILALGSLGYSSAEALRATKAIKSYENVEDLLKQALKQLAKV